MPAKGKNSFGIPYHRTGIPAVDQVLWRILDALDQLRIQPSATASGSTGPGGTLVTARGGQTVWRSGPPAPWTMSGEVVSGDLTLYFQPALVNNVVPKIGSDFINANPRPGLVVTGTSGTTYARATVDAAGTITDLIILSGGSVPADTTTGTLYKYKFIGTWTASGGAFTSTPTILNTNQTFRMCGGLAEWY